mmetsp:Transcript_75354/g.218849  ORF Transcript_75354/g.218849 Transcript_75354/m.218849 type:complete len:216 (+) Transcript_75354:812-1459(+)
MDVPRAGLREALLRHRRRHRRRCGPRRCDAGRGFRDATWGGCDRGARLRARLPLLSAILLLGEVGRRHLGRLPVSWRGRLRRHRSHRALRDGGRSVLWRRIQACRRAVARRDGYGIVLCCGDPAHLLRSSSLHDHASARGPRVAGLGHGPPRRAGILRSSLGPFVANEDLPGEACGAGDVRGVDGGGGVTAQVHCFRRDLTGTSLMRRIFQRGGS